MANRTKQHPTGNCSGSVIVFAVLNLCSYINCRDLIWRHLTKSLEKSR